jgi:hypothetical protein
MYFICGALRLLDSGTHNVDRRLYLTDLLIFNCSNFVAILLNSNKRSNHIGNLPPSYAGILLMSHHDQIPFNLNHHHGLQSLFATDTKASQNPRGPGQGRDRLSFGSGKRQVCLGGSCVFALLTTLLL